MNILWRLASSTMFTLGLRLKNMVSYNCFIALRVVLFANVLLILRIFVVMTYLFPLLIVSSIESMMRLVILVPITCRVLSDLTSRWLRVLAKPYFPLKTREKSCQRGNKVVQYPVILTLQSWLIKDLLCCQKHSFSCGKSWVSKTGPSCLFL